MTEEWATCIDCGWIGIVDNNVTACPWCGYMPSTRAPMTEKEKRDVQRQYGEAGFYASTRFMSWWRKWKR